MDCCEKPMAEGRVVCPKPRRVGQRNINSPSVMMPLRFHIRNEADTKAGAELPYPFPRKDDYKAERCTTLSSSPPFLFGSPPCRTQNPLIHDAHFGVKKLTFMRRSSAGSASPGSNHAIEHSGNKQVAVRVEGFDCQGSRVLAMANNSYCI